MGLGPWANPRLMVTQLVMEEAHGPVAPPFGGEYSRERLVEGQPRWPPLTLGFVLVGFTGEFADILGLIACKLITSFLYSSTVIILHAR